MHHRGKKYLKIKVNPTENMASEVSDDEGQWKHKAGDVG